jgi:hypothetical protein
MTTKAPDILRNGSKGPRVKALQVALMRAGLSLPRFGADGDLGFETLDAAEAFADDDTRDNTPGDTIPLELEARILAAAPAVFANPTGGTLTEVAPGVIDARRMYSGKSYPTRNPWASIDTICLHQMAVDARSDWTRWRKLAIHFAVCREGPTAWLNGLDRRVAHGHGWNSRSVGFEVEGHFAGVANDPKTHWTPEGAKGSRLIPQALTPSQVSGALAAIAFVVEEVKRNGGAIKYVGAHRQSYGRKTSDPGELIWKFIALPAMRAHGLVTAPTLSHPKFPGRPIPEAWDSAQKGVKY